MPVSPVRSIPSRDLSIVPDEVIGPVSARLMRPRGADWLYLMAHGAGAGMHHEFLSGMAERLYRRGIATLRYQFPYMEAGRKRPDHQKRLVATVRAALETARRKVRLPLVAGGKSMGGRMTSLALAERAHPRVAGLLFLGFPLHAPGKVTSERAVHLQELSCPMLFVQGTRDSLANLDLMQELERSLGEPARMHVVHGGDHSFKVLKRSGRTRDQVLDEIADAIARWGREVIVGD